MSSPTSHLRDDPLRGVAYLFAAILGFGALEATAKHLTASYPIPQIVWARFTFHLLAMLPFVFAVGFYKVVRTNRLKLQLYRSALQLAATCAMFFGISKIGLSEATAIVYLSPLVITALSAPMLGERVSLRQWAAVIVGFVGVLIILRPGSGALHWAAFGLIGTALAYALFQIATRQLGSTEHWLTTAIYTPIVGTLGAGLAVPFVWVPPTPEDWLFFIGLGAFAGLAHLLVIRAFQYAAASWLAPFNYVHIIWGTILGYLIFGQLPDIWTVAGGMLVVASGLYVIIRTTRSRSQD